MVKYRSQRGGLAESMATEVELNDFEALVQHLHNTGYKNARTKNVTVEAYSIDQRIGWNTYIVSIEGDAVGFTNGPLKEEENAD